ncbi:hypothetical protein ACFV23_02175 [Streptomyces sp. NPDC059627]
MSTAEAISHRSGIEGGAHDRIPDPEGQWFRWSARHPVASLLIVGAIATQMATTIGYFLPAVKLPSLAWPLYSGVLAAPQSGYGTAGSFMVGELTHLLNGIVFAFVFGILLYRKLPFGYGAAGNMLKALTYGAALTILSSGVLVPFVYQAGKGYGLFSFSGPDGWKLPLAILIWHLVYVVHIAALYNPSRAHKALLEEHLAAS